MLMGRLRGYQIKFDEDEEDDPEIWSADYPGPRPSTAEPSPIIYGVANYHGGLQTRAAIPSGALTTPLLAKEAERAITLRWGNKFRHWTA